MYFVLHVNTEELANTALLHNTHLFQDFYQPSSWVGVLSHITNIRITIKARMERRATTDFIHATLKPNVP